MTRTQEITLDVYEAPYFVYVNAKQKDNDSRVLVVTLTDRGQEIRPDHTSDEAVFRARKPDGTCVLEQATIGEDGKITVALSDQALAVPGDVEADIAVVNGDDILSTATFYIQVTRAPVGEEVASENDFLLLLDARDRAEAAAKVAAESERLAGEHETAAGESAKKAGEERTAAETAAQLAGEHEQGAKKAEADAKESAETAKQYSGNPAIIGENETWEIWNAESGAYADTGKPSRGEAGFSPTVDVKKEGKKTTITITDETGPHAAEILDGEDVVGVSSFNGKTGDIVSNGMNLYEGTRDFTGAKWVGNISPYITNEKYKGLSVFSAETHWINSYQKVEVEAGEYYTVSFYARTDEVNDQSPITVSTFIDGKIDNEIAPMWSGVPITTEWARYSRTVKAKKTGVTGFVVANQMNTLPIPRFYICGIKVEHGNAATDWTPSPNDITVPVDIWGIPRAHRAIFRGKNLGSVITDEQKAAIAAANWDDLYIGDYWTIDGRNWRIADFDYWYYRGDKYCETHHIVVVPESALYSARMNDTASTDGGYYNSEMRTKNLDQAKEMITSAFGAESILTHRIQLSNASSNGVVTGSIWTDSDVDLMNAAMVFGHRHPASSWAGDEAEQLALFQMANYYTVALWGNYWLRDVYNATDFCTASCYGGISHFNSAMADYHYVRPAVGIIGG